ncbi:MAG: RloB family protein [Myxococcota bacterium]
MFAEGKTEEGWAAWLRRTTRHLNIELQCVGESGVPTTLLSKAKAKAAELGGARRGTHEERDEVWIVFDKDAHHSVPSVLQEAYDAGIGVVYSNACFELWPLLHIDSHTRDEERGRLQHLLKEAHPCYDHDSGAVVNWDALRGHTATAIQRARDLHRAGQEALEPLRSPSTTAWLLHERCAAGSSATDQTIELPDEWAVPLRRCLPRRLRPRER